MACTYCGPIWGEDWTRDEVLAVFLGEISKPDKTWTIGQKCDSAKVAEVRFGTPQIGCQVLEE